MIHGQTLDQCHDWRKQQIEGEGVKEKSEGAEGEAEDGLRGHKPKALAQADF